MKSLLFLLLLVLAAAPAGRAQPSSATAKTKVTSAGQPSVKVKTTPAEAAADVPFVAPNAALVDAKANALTANMQKNMGLSSQQTEKVRVINRRGIEQVESGRLRYKADPRKLANLVDIAGRSRLEALKDVLNAAQFDKYQRKREEKMGVPNAQGVQGTPPPGLGGGGAGDQ